MLSIEVKGHSTSSGSANHLFSEEHLHTNWTIDAVNAIERSLKSGKWERCKNIELRAKRVKTLTGWEGS